MKTKRNDFWLDDDPEWEALRQRTANKPENKNPPTRQPLAVEERIDAAPRASVEPKKVQVSLDLALPQLSLPKLTPSQLRWAKFGLPAVAFMVLAVILVPKLFKSQPSHSTGVLSSVVKEPEFKTVLPSGKKDETTNGSVAYDASKKVASFTDNISGVAVTVSQQPVPEPFKANLDDQVQKLAESFSANEIIASSTPKAYLGTSIKGPQTVIFAKKDLLVFITSDSKIEKDVWAEYITKLY